MNDLHTVIQVEARLVDEEWRLVVVRGGGPDMATYTTHLHYGWQRYPDWWILAHSEHIEPEEVEDIVGELEARAFHCEFVPDVFIEKGDEYEQTLDTPD